MKCCLFYLAAILYLVQADDDHVDNAEKAAIANVCGEAFKYRTLDLKILQDGNAIDGGTGPTSHPDGHIDARELMYEARRYDTDLDGCVTWEEFLAQRQSRGYSEHLSVIQFNDHFLHNDAGGCRGIKYGNLFNRHNRFTCTLDDFNNYQILSIIKICETQEKTRQEMCECRGLDHACRSTGLSHLPACTIYDALPTSGSDLKAFENKIWTTPKDKPCELCDLCNKPPTPITKLVCGLLRHAEADAEDIHAH